MFLQMHYLLTTGGITTRYQLPQEVVLLVLLIGLIIVHARRKGHNPGEKRGRAIVRQDGIVVALSFITSINISNTHMHRHLNMHHLNIRMLILRTIPTFQKWNAIVQHVHVLVVISFITFLQHCIHCMNRSD